MRPSRLLLAVSSLLLAFAAHAQDATPETVDAGPTASPDAAAPDSIVDGGVDGAVDAGAVDVDAGPSAAADEPQVVDGWRIVSFTSGRRLPDGRPTEERCGTERDVVVERLVDPQVPTKESLPPVVTKAVLLVPCVKDANGALVAGTPALRLPPEHAPRSAAPAAVQPAAEDAPVFCGEGENPKKEADLKPGERACTPPDRPKPCLQGEKPKKPEELKPGEAACMETESERGVPFLKGELSHMGDVQLVNSRSSIGVALGVAAIDNVYYAVVRPDVNFRYGNFSAGLGAPLRFQVADLNGIDVTNPGSTDSIFADAGRFRTEDWDQIEDFLRPLRYATWGKKEDNLYIDVNRVHAITIGHGQLMRRYTGNIDIDEDNLFAVVDGYRDFGGFELMAGPFPIPRLAGGLLFVKPLGLFRDDVLSKSWSVGVSAITDLNAPTGLDKRQNPADGRTQLAVDRANQFGWQGRANPVGAMVQGVGADTELKVLKTDLFDLKVYGDYSHLFFPADTSPAAAFEAFNGGGFTLGGLLRMSFGTTPVRDLEDETEAVQKGQAPREMKAAHAVRVRLEARTFSAQFMPSYWNTLYEVDRLQFGQTVGDERLTRATLPTKVGFLAARADEPWRAGLYTEASYAWVDVLAVTVAYEDAYALGDAALPVDGRNLALHVESQGLGFIQAFATYHYRNFDRLDGLFSFNTDNEIFFFGGRLQVLPFLFINAGAQRAFRVGYSEDDSPLFNDDGLRFSSTGLQNVWTGNVDVELGWQF